MKRKPARPRAGPLGDEDLALWEAVARSVRPLGSRQGGVFRPPAVRRTTAAPLRLDPLPEPAAGLAPALAGRRLLRRLGRETVPIDSRLDLHGMTQEAAWQALCRHLSGAARRGDRIVLVITGKGGARSPQLGGVPAQYRRRAEFDPESGVLRRMVPLWLAGAELAPQVAAVAPAHIRHGGAGALYVMLRRQRPRD